MVGQCDCLTVFRAELSSVRLCVCKMCSFGGIFCLFGQNVEFKAVLGSFWGQWGTVHAEY